MKTRLSIVLVIAFALMFCLAVAVMAAEKAESGEKGGAQTVTFAQLPKAVQKTLTKHVGQGGKIDEIEKETENGKVVYSADVTKADGKMYDIVIGSGGRFIREEIDKPGEKEGDETGEANEKGEKGEAGEKGETE